MRLSLCLVFENWLKWLRPWSLGVGSYRRLVEASCRLSRGVPKVIVVAVSMSPISSRPLGFRRLSRSTLQHSLFEVGLSSF